MDWLSGVAVTLFIFFIYLISFTPLLSLMIFIQLLSDNFLLSTVQLSKRLPSSTWVLVYSTYLHGISLSTLYYRMRDFETPVLVVIKDSKGYVSAACALSLTHTDICIESL